MQGGKDKLVDTEQKKMEQSYKQNDKRCSVKIATDNSHQVWIDHGKGCVII